MQRVGFGINNLQPGEEREVDWTIEFIEDVVKPHSIYKKIKLTKIEGITETEPEILPIEEGEKPEEQPSVEKGTGIEEKESDLTLLDYKSLKAIGKNYGINAVGMTKSALLEEIQHKIDELKA